MKPEYILIAYLVLINIIASLSAIIDKRKAIKGKWRIPESFLMFVGLIGGAFLELITMKIIHHKTRHKKFMIGLPVEIILQIILAIFIIKIY